MGKLKLAILDFYDGEPNQGMRSIKEIVSAFGESFDWKVFDVRGKCEIPDFSYDIFICSGGPGSPLDGDGNWNVLFYTWMDDIWKYNQEPNERKKYVLFICHSFQMACDHFDIARVLPRRSRSFGTTHIHKTHEGMHEPFFEALDDPFTVADFRFWQVVQPDRKAFERMGAEILALEKIRPHVPLERAIMAVRFSKEIFGTQFHPEADPVGMLIHFNQPEKKAEIIQQHGQEKFDRMIQDLKDPRKLPATYDKIIPRFLMDAIENLNTVKNENLV